MTRTAKAMLCVALIAGTNALAAPATSSASRKLQALFPDALKHSYTRSSEVISFCPDNTCIEVRSTRGANAEKWSLIYLYHLGGYSDLERWRVLPGIRAEIEGLGKSLKVSDCVGHGVNRGCLLKRLGANGVEIYNVRSDEDGRTAVRVK